MQGGNGVVVLIASAIVDKGFGEGGFDGGSCGRRVLRERHGQFEEIEGGTGIAVCKGSEVIDQSVVDE